MPDFFLDDKVNHSVHASQYTISGGPAHPAPSSAASESAAPSSGLSGGEIASVMNSIKEKLNEELVQKTNAMYQFDVKGS